MDTEPPMQLPIQQQQNNNNNNNNNSPEQQQNTQQLQNELTVVRYAGRQAVRNFLESHNCFAVLRKSGKVVVFDTRIPIQLAFYALVEHDMLAAPLWDPVKCQFVGLLTVTDFIDILRHYRATNKDVSALAISSISTVLSELPNDDNNGNNNNELSKSTNDGSSNKTSKSYTTTTTYYKRPFHGADSSCTLKQACKQLICNRQDFLPIVFAEDMRVLACITYTNILEFMVTHFREQRRLFDDSIYDLGIGTYGDGNVITVTPQNTLAEALYKMYQHNLSALPVVENTNNMKVIGMYSRSDITFLTRATDAEDAVRNLDLPISELLAQSRQDVTTPDALRTCSPQHTLQAIFESFSQFRFNRLCVIDNTTERLLGIVSAKDLVAYFLSDNDE